MACNNQSQQANQVCLTDLLSGRPMPLPSDQTLKTQIYVRKDATDTPLEAIFQLAYSEWSVGLGRYFRRDKLTRLTLVHLKLLHENYDQIV